MAAWPTVRLADCVDLLAGFPFKSARFSDRAEGGVPLVKGENVSQGQILWAASRYWPAQEFEQHSKFHLVPGDVVVAMDRPWVPAGLKWAAIRIGNPKALLVQRCARLRSNTPKLAQEYLRCVIGGPDFVDYIRPITTGVNVPHVSGAQILAFSFPLPRLEEQRRIADILSAYDDLIENCERRIRVLDEAARALYREWFVDTGTATGASTFADLATLGRSAVDPRRHADETFAHFSIPAFDAGRVPVIERGSSIQSNKQLVPAGCVLLSKLNPRIPRVWLPVVGDEHRSVASTEFLVLEPRASAGATQELLYCLCSSADFSAAFTALAIGTSNSHQRVKPESLLRMPITRPDTKLIAKASSHWRPWIRQMDVLRSEIRNLRQTRDLVLPRLLSGQLSVDDAA